MRTVFISSTSRDLGPYREAAMLACRELGLAVSGMEDFEAMGVGATAGSLRKLDAAHVYVGIFAHRYGYVEPGDARSVTEREFDHAGERGLDRLCFVVDPKYPWPPESIEFDQKARLDAFKGRIARLIINWFTDVAGFRHKVYKALAEWKRQADGAAAREPAPPRQLPRPPADFVGRGDILDRLDGHVAGGVTILGLHGLGGIGKTALALKLGERLGPRCPDGHIYLDLKGVDPRPLTWQEAMAHVLHAFHPAERLPSGDAELAGRYRSVLSGRRVLLLLDNAAGREQVEPLLPPDGGSLVLVTSRRRFHLPGLAACDLDALPPADAAALLRAIAPRLDAAAAAALAEACGYLPLALRLAGAALAERDDLSPGQYLKRLRAARLTELDEVAARVRVSEELLPEPLRTRWRELEVLVGDFEAAWAAAVWGVDEATADGYLGTLRRGSLLGWVAAAEVYRLHDLVREYARGRLEAAARAEAERRHARYFCRVIGDADDLYRKGGVGITEALRVFDRAWPNAQTGFAWVRDRLREDEQTARLCRDYATRTWYVRNLRQHPRDRIAWLETVIEAARHLTDRRGESNALGGLGLAYADLGQPQRAIELYEQWLAIAREVGDRQGEGQALGNLGNAYAALGQPQRAIEFHQQHLALAREVGDRRGEGNALCNLGIAYKNLGQPQRAIECYQQDLAIAREIGDRHGEAITSWNLGLVYEEQGDLTAALPCLEACVCFEREIGHADADKDAAHVERIRQRLAGG